MPPVRHRDAKKHSNRHRGQDRPPIDERHHTRPLLGDFHETPGGSDHTAASATANVRDGRLLAIRMTVGL